MQDTKPTVVIERTLLSAASGKEKQAPPITVRFGATVRGLRHRLGISQETLAERADLHRTYIADIEGGRRNVTLKTMDRLARALEVSLAALLTPTGEPSSDAVDNPPPKPGMDL